QAAGAGLGTRACQGDLVISFEYGFSDTRRLAMTRVIRHATRAWPAALAAAAMVVLTCMQLGAQNDPQAAVNAAFNKFKTLKEGKNADYIPALAKVDPNLFGI